MDLKRVRADHLLNSLKTDVSSEQMEENEARRRRCRLTALLESTDRTEVRHFVHELMACLAREHIFPPPQDKVNRHIYDQTDIDAVQQFVTDTCSAGNTVAMKALILTGLRVSALFVQVFCPPPSPTMDRRFLVNPAKLQTFLLGPGKGLVHHISSFVVMRLGTPEHFVSTCMATWAQLAPWKDYEAWGAVSTNESSAELHDVHKRQRLGPSADPAEHALLASAGSDHALLDY